MSRLLSKKWIWALLPLAAAAFFAGASIFYSHCGYRPPPVGHVPVEQVVNPPSLARGFTETPAARKGLLLVDNTHFNRVGVNDLNVLLARVADRGYEIEFMGNRNFRFFFSSERRSLLSEKLPRADSLIVALPAVSFETNEIESLRRFVAKGGRLLFLGDPGRPNSINGVADSFGIVFQDGYLYNLKDHDLNFRNILIDDFQSDEITDGLTQIAMYTAGSIKSFGAPLAFTDENTYSSMVERVESFTPVVKTADGNVLAIADVTFLVPPNNSTLDNDRFISNIADFLTTGDRRLDIHDFPHFFGEEVDILLGRPGLFDTGTRMKSILFDLGISADISRVDDLTRDAIFLGLYLDSPAASQYLSVGGIQVGDTIRTPFTPDVPAGGTAIVLLHKEQDRRVLVVLGEDETILKEMVSRLGSGEFTEGLVSDTLGVYQVLGR